MRAPHAFRSTAVAAAALAAGLAVPASAQQAVQEAAHPARATLVDSQGGQLGTAALIETPDGLLIQLEAEGLPAGAHGFHIHETGACEAPGFKSAGSHFAPEGNAHGFLPPGGHHAGDLPNIHPEDDGRVRADVFAAGLSLDGDGGSAALLDDDGAALVIHATADDYQSDPAGHAGDRIACGVIERGAAEQ